MSNWIAITETSVKTAKNSLILASVQGRATANGEADPVPKMIADVTARIRAACSTGNQLDADPTKLPNSLEGLALRMIVRRLKDYLEVGLSEDERDQRHEDAAYLNRISEDKLRFETPDSPAGNAEMQSAGGAIETVSRTDRRPYTRRGLEGLL